MDDEQPLSRDLRLAGEWWGHRVAVVDESTGLTYAELTETVQRVANALRDHGVRRGDCVVWHGQKSAAAVVAIHGILRAGAAYVPLDPDGPMARADLIRRQGRPRAMVADRAARDRWRSTAPDLHWYPLLPSTPRTGDLWVSAVDHGEQEVVDGIASVLHTSGSTGVPKGVVHTHSSAAAFVDWAVGELRLTGDDVLVNSAPLHFDLSVLDLFAASRVGATVALVPPTASSFPSLYAEFVARVGATVWYTVPSTLGWLTRRGVELLAKLRSVRVAAFAGEVLHPAEVDKVLSALPHARVLNLYGPTETNVCTFHEVRRPRAGTDTIPIGRPLPGTEVRIVDGGFVPVPSGEPGQLLVRGPTMMSGYWRAPRETTRAFVTDPDGQRWYATGDEVHLGDGGELEFIGRADDQVKVHGYRIELGEVERGLRFVPAVKECAVVAVRHNASTVLVAFVRVDRPEDLRSLSDLLRATLPHYMVPHRFVAVDGELPRLSNGKVDRVALAAIAQRPASDSGRHGQPAPAGA